MYNVPKESEVEYAVWVIRKECFIFSNRFFNSASPIIKIIRKIEPSEKSNEVRGSLRKSILVGAYYNQNYG